MGTPILKDDINWSLFPTDPNDLYHPANERNPYHPSNPNRIKLKGGIVQNSDNPYNPDAPGNPYNPENPDIPPLPTPDPNDPDAPWIPQPPWIPNPGDPGGQLIPNPEYPLNPDNPDSPWHRPPPVVLPPVECDFDFGLAVERAPRPRPVREEITGTTFQAMNGVLTTSLRPVEPLKETDPETGLTVPDTGKGVFDFRQQFLEEVPNYFANIKEYRDKQTYCEDPFIPENEKLELLVDNSKEGNPSGIFYIPTGGLTSSGASAVFDWDIWVDYHYTGRYSGTSGLRTRGIELNVRPEQRVPAKKLTATPRYTRINRNYEYEYAELERQIAALQAAEEDSSELEQQFEEWKNYHQNSPGFYNGEFEIRVEADGRWKYIPFWILMTDGGRMMEKGLGIYEQYLTVEGLFERINAGDTVITVKKSEEPELGDRLLQGFIFYAPEEFCIKNYAYVLLDFAHTETIPEQWWRTRLDYPLDAVENVNLMDVGMCIWKWEGIVPDTVLTVTDTDWETVNGESIVPGIFGNVNDYVTPQSKTLQTTTETVPVIMFYDGDILWAIFPEGVGNDCDVFNLELNGVAAMKPLGLAQPILRIRSKWYNPSSGGYTMGTFDGQAIVVGEDFPYDEINVGINVPNREFTYTPPDLDGFWTLDILLQPDDAANMFVPSGGVNPVVIEINAAAISGELPSLPMDCIWRFAGLAPETELTIEAGHFYGQISTGEHSVSGSGSLGFVEEYAAPQLVKFGDSFAMVQYDGVGNLWVAFLFLPFDLPNGCEVFEGFQFAGITAKRFVVWDSSRVPLPAIDCACSRPDSWTFPSNWVLGKPEEDLFNRVVNGIIDPESELADCDPWEGKKYLDDTDWIPDLDRTCLWRFDGIAPDTELEVIAPEGFSEFTSVLIPPACPENYEWDGETCKIVEQGERLYRITSTQHHSMGTGHHVLIFDGTILGTVGRSLIDWRGTQNQGLQDVTLGEKWPNVLWTDCQYRIDFDLDDPNAWVLTIELEPTDDPETIVNRAGGTVEIIQEPPTLPQLPPLQDTFGNVNDFIPPAPVGISFKYGEELIEGYGIYDSEAQRFWVSLDLLGEMPCEAFSEVEIAGILPVQYERPYQNLAKIIIRPHWKAPRFYGWLRAFAFHSTSVELWNQQENKNKVLEANMEITTSMFCDSPEDAGNYCMRYFFHGCENLKIGEKFIFAEDWANVKRAGREFMAHAFRDCISIERFPDNYQEPQTLTEVGDDFKAYKCYGCSSLQSLGAVLTAPPGLRKIGHGFETFEYAYCYSLITLPDSYREIQEIDGRVFDFQMCKFVDCYNLSVLPTGYTEPNVIEVGNNYQAYKFQNCNLITLPDSYREAPALSYVGINYQVGKFMGCRQLATLPAIYTEGLPAFVDRNFIKYKFKGCCVLTVPATYHFPIVGIGIKTEGVFEEVFPNSGGIAEGIINDNTEPPTPRRTFGTGFSDHSQIPANWRM